jgi:hypothetical protein
MVSKSHACCEISIYTCHSRGGNVGINHCMQKVSVVKVAEAKDIGRRPYKKCCYKYPACETTATLASTIKLYRSRLAIVRRRSVREQETIVISHEPGSFTHTVALALTTGEPSPSEFDGEEIIGLMIAPADPSQRLRFPQVPQEPAV